MDSGIAEVQGDPGDGRSGHFLQVAMRHQVADSMLDLAQQAERQAPGLDDSGRRL